MVEALSCSLLELFVVLRIKGSRVRRNGDHPTPSATRLVRPQAPPAVRTMASHGAAGRSPSPPPEAGASQANFGVSEVIAAGQDDGARLRMLTARMEDMMGSDSISDCIIVVEGVEFPCLRGVLAAGSTFFKAMFYTSDMAERRSGRAVLTDVTATGWKAVRLWLYTAQVRFEFGVWHCGWGCGDYLCRFVRVGGVAALSGSVRM